MEEMKSVIAGEYEFEYRDKSKLKPFFQRFGLSGVWCKNWIAGVLIACSFINAKFSVETVMAELKPVITEEYEFQPLVN